MLKKVNVKRAFACLLVLFALMAALMAFGEGAVEATPSATEAPAETNSDYDPYDLSLIHIASAVWGKVHLSSWGSASATAMPP